MENFIFSYYTKLDALSSLNNLNNHNYHLFSVDKDETGKKYFSLMTNQIVFQQIISSNSYIYENYNDQQPIKFFLDIDCKRKTSSYNDIDQLINDCLQLFEPIFNSYNYFNYPIIILNATTIVKYSLHIIFPSIIFKSTQHIKQFMSLIKSKLIDDKIIDLSVYRNGCFRVNGCSKKGKNNKLKFFKSYNYEFIDENKCFIDTLLTNINSNNFINFNINKNIDLTNKTINNSVNKPTNKLINFHFSNKLCLCVTPSDEQINNILNLLPNDYLDSYDKWLIVLNVMKGLNKYNLWKNWCSKSSKFNEIDNLFYWDSTNNIFIDINYLIHIINNQTENKLSYFATYKQYDPLTYAINFDKVINNKKYVSEILTYELFDKYDTILIDSNTGTGKSFCVGTHTAENKNLQIISISCLISLINQHVKAFNELGLNMKSYESEFNITNNIAICINSLMKLSKITNKQLSNCILYLDEISSFLLLTHNSTLDHIIKPIYDLLVRFIKNCKKLILSDAFINDQCLDIVNLRTNKKLFVKNLYQKYNGIKAIKINDKNVLLNKLIDKCKNNEHFIFASDSRKSTELFYNECINKSKEEHKNKYILLTKNSNYKPKNVSEEWKDKFVFYSPKIVYGVDFSINEPEDVFLCITGKTLMPPLLFQQATRCRNINKLYYYYDNKCKFKNKYYDIEHCESLFNDCVEYNDKINDVCKVLDESDNLIFIKNSFYKLFIKNEYMFDCYNSNKLYFFEKLLKDKGFVLENYCEYTEIKQVINYKNIIDNNELFDKFIKSTQKDIIEFGVFNERIKILNLSYNNELLTKYKNIIIDKNNFEDHLNIIRFLKSDLFIENKLNELTNNSFTVKSMDNVYNKINLLRKLMTKYNIDYFNIKFIKPDLTEINFEEKEWIVLKKIFRITKEKPKNMYELIIQIVGMIKNITCSDIIISKKIKNDNKWYHIYDFNYNNISHHLILDNYANINNINFYDKIYKIFNIVYHSYL